LKQERTENQHLIRLVSPKGNWNGNMKSSDTALDAPVIVGPGRVGRSLAAALPAAELRGRCDSVDDLSGRVVLLCVPDSEIGNVARRIGASGAVPALAGHTSGATSLEALSDCGAEGRFSVHPLQTVPDGSTDLQGCPAAVAGDSGDALEFARGMAAAAGMTAFEISETDRVAYHAAASIASNFLITVEQTAAEILGGISVENPRQVLEPLVRRSLENWIDRGSSALTGPIARGDESTVEAHRQVLAERWPELLDFYDSTADRTRSVAMSAGTS
jgi:predicted short-subunit dehydrogenase-like oxidoreductase (DUF2520 family)